MTDEERQKIDNVKEALRALNIAIAEISRMGVKVYAEAEDATMTYIGSANVQRVKLILHRQTIDVDIKL